MKKFIIPLLLMFSGMSASCEVFPFGSDQFVKLGGNLELIVKKQNNAFYQRYQTPKYGVRQNGVILLKPEFSPKEVVLPADLFLLVFFDAKEKIAHVYSTETGEEVLTHQWLSNTPETSENFLRFEFREISVDGKRQYQLVELIDCQGTVSENIIATFFRRRIATYMTKPGKSPSPISYYY